MVNVPRFGLSLVLVAQSFGQPDGAGDPGSGMVFTTTNEASGNRLAFFRRAPGGPLGDAGFVSTGGLGTGTGLGNQSALAFGGAGGRTIYGVNAASDTVSAFLLTAAGPVLVAEVESGGDRPISVAARGDTVYVLNAGGGAGGTDTIVGFRAFPPMGIPVQIPGSTRPLSDTSTGPAQVGFSPDRRVLVVTEKMTNLITTYVLDGFGLAGAPVPQPSSGMTPFGFAFNVHGHLIVSEAFGGAPDASAVSSYSVGADGTLAVIDGSVPTTETAACWIANTRNGRFSYTTNTGSNTVSGYAVDATGELTLLTPGGATAPTGSGGAPTDAAAVGNRFLYVLNSATGEIVGYGIGHTGGLAELTRVAGLPPNSTGLVAR